MLKRMSRACVTIGLLFLDATGGFHFAPSPRRRRQSRDLTCFERRIKKNKYANFSKADKLKIDPMESLIQQSHEQNEILVKENRKHDNMKDIDYNEKRNRNEILFPDNREIDPYDPTSYGYIELGTITGAHGIKGEMKITAVTDFAERLCQKGPRHLKRPTRRSPRRTVLLSGRHRKDDEYLIQLEGIGDRDTANALRGCVLYAREEQKIETLNVDEYIVKDLVGLEVFLKEGYKNEDGVDEGEKFVGVVNGIVLAGDMSSVPGLGQDWIEISLQRGPGDTASLDDELVLIPFVPQLVPLIDMERNCIYIDPPYGILDLTYVRHEKTRIKGFLPPAKE
mmetsp:Transcript_22729/g.34378  ORF Transcript_22729/g.34378 Transcript_22729/m.34378 type:complete len:338 (+) Transcript_22729:102-1115(+)